MDDQIAKDVAAFEKAFGRKLVHYAGDDPMIFAIYHVQSDQPLTGFLLYLPEPMVDHTETHKQPSVCFPIASWIMAKSHSDETVTPTLVLARGKRDLIYNTWLPHTGLKYPVRDVEGIPYVYVPVEDFKKVKR